MKNNNESAAYNSFLTDNKTMKKRLFLLGICISILLIWNGVCDFIYAYSPDLNGKEYLSPAVFEVILTANNRPHWMILLAQTAGWLYPIYALTYYHWWVGTRKAGFWTGHVSILLLVYAVLMIGGIQHAGWAFLSVLEQAKSVVGSTDQAFFALANQYIIEHFIMGDLTASIALSVGTLLHAIGILSGKTMYPRWFIVVSPLGVLTFTGVLGANLPAPYAGFVLALFGTWFMLIPNIATTLWLWKNDNYE